MSKLTEYLSLINKGMENPSQVAEGWLNVVKKELGALPEDQLEEIARRRAICNECPHMSANAVKAGIYKSKRNDLHCSLCSCPIKAKTSSLSSTCGAKYWNENPPKETPLDIRWTNYESNKD